MYIDGLTQGLEVKGSLPVGRDVQQPEQFPVDAAGRGDDRGQEGVTLILGRPPNLCQPSPEMGILIPSLPGRHPRHDNDDDDILRGKLVCIMKPKVLFFLFMMMFLNLDFFCIFLLFSQKSKKKLPFDGGALSQLDRDMLDMCGQSPARSRK